MLVLLLTIAGVQTIAQAQITQLKDYKNYTSAPIGTFQGINFREAGFSGIYPIPNTNGKEFWITTDRGVNVDAANANPSGCTPTYDKIYAFPAYAPKIFRIRLNGDSVQILQTISIKRPDGTTATGIINPTGLGSTATEVASTDTVLNCANFNAKIAPKDTFGIDAEGIVVDKNGYFWLCEEGGPTIWKLNSNGVVVKRYTPYGNMPGLQSVDVAIDTIFKYRKNNRGFENLALTPSGKIYALIQSPLLNPNTSVGENTRIHRMLEIDPATNATRMFVYLNDGIIGSSGSNQIRLRDWKLGDMVAINDSTFLVLEAALRGTTDIKRMYMINIGSATTVNSGLYSGVSLEALVDSTGLANNGIKAVKKTLVMDLLANSWPSALDKAEGLTILNDSTLVLCNDNDYGQTSAPQNGVATATTNLSHVFVYGLSGANKLQNYKAPSAPIDLGMTGPSTNQTPYLTSVLPGVKFTSILTATENAGSYKMCGTPDGLGAFDNGNGTFTLLMNHEFTNTAGVARAHGSTGAFVSKWIIKKSDLSVVSGSDLIQNVKLWNGTGYTTYNASNPSTLAAFTRFCSGDLPAVSAFYNGATGLGTQERIFMNGEESGNEGRAFGHIVTGLNAGTTYELPHLGKFSWENSVACPVPADKTIVAGMDDSTPGQVYFYIGTKTGTGTEVDKAGLTNGKLFGVSVNGLLTESSASIPTPNTKFTLVDLGIVRDSSGASTNSRSNNLGVTSFQRPEDGAWDPAHPNDFYFATTNAITAPSRLWKLHFNNITSPELGGTITAVLDGTEGQKMLDNITIDSTGHILLVEDVGSNIHDGKIWQYTIATDQLVQLGQHDSTRFVTGGGNFLTIDEEASGILDVQSILGPGMFLTVDQAHYAIPGEAVEGGQLLAMYNPASYNSTLGAGPSSSQSPYLMPTNSNVKFFSLLTAGDTVGAYKMCGTPDGLGAFDNGDGTFTVLANHEFANTAGVARAHGSAGSFVSKWVINKSTMTVASGSDLIRTVKLWNGTGYTTYNASTPSPLTAFNRFCSADLPPVSAFFNSASGLGTQERIFMNGEESGNEGRAFGHIVTGPNGGTTYELPHLGKFSWENSVACPVPADKTIVAGMDDSTPGQVYFYIGTKTNIGTEVDKAGLTNGKLYGVAVTGLLTEVSASVPAPNTVFTLVDLGTVRDSTGAGLNTRSNNLGVTTFLRPEDGAWDPSSPNDFYFNTTNAITAPSRLWKLHFNNIATPELGGTITAVLDGTEGQKMLDNMTIDNFGHILLVEDVGNNVHDGKIWQYTIATDSLKQIGYHDSSRFVSGPNFLTQDEEASGILDVQGILGAGFFLVDNQAHYPVPGELVEGGQLLIGFNPDTYTSNPEAGIVSNNVEIADGDNTPSATDNTDFGSAGMSRPQLKTFTVKNTGIGPLKISGISFTGTSAPEFTLSPAITFPLTVAANAATNFTVAFAPAATGLRTAILTVSTNDFDESKYDFMIQGTGIAPEARIQGAGTEIADGDNTPSATDLTDFGNVGKGKNNIRTFTITNTGTDTLKVNAINITGAQAAEFTLAPALTFPLNVLANASQTFTVKFAPLATGLRNATITVVNNDQDESSYDFAVQGTSVAPEINVQGSGVTIADGDNTPSAADNTDFGHADNGISQTHNFVVQNTGSDSLVISGIGFTGTNAGDFSLQAAPALPIVIVPNASQTLTVKFAPLAEGTRNASINITCNDEDESTYDFALTGIRTDAHTGIGTAAAAEASVKLYPNPAGDEAIISMVITQKSHVSISVFDLQGKLVMPAIDRSFEPGEQQVSLRTAVLHNGIYFVEVNSAGHVTRIKTVIAH